MLVLVIKMVQKIYNIYNGYLKYVNTTNFAGKENIIENTELKGLEVYDFPKVNIKNYQKLGFKIENNIIVSIFDNGFPNDYEEFKKEMLNAIEDEANID